MLGLKFSYILRNEETNQTTVKYRFYLIGKSLNENDEEELYYKEFVQESQITLEGIKTDDEIRDLLAEEKANLETNPEYGQKP